MALPNSGLLTAQMINVELGRAATAPFNLNGAAERALAGKPTGPISMSDFYGKSSEIVVRITANGTTNDLVKNLFSPADWASDTTKRLIINPGVEISGEWGYALAISDNASGASGSFGGELIIENRGYLSGKPGNPNGGAGGAALYANMKGKNGQKAKLYNYGTIRSGGGGGGRGGNGGNGTATTTQREPASGEYYDTSNRWEFANVAGPGPYTMNPGCRYWWAGAYVEVTRATGGNQNYTQHDNGGWTYYRGSKREEGAVRNAQNGQQVGGYERLGVYRAKQATVGTSGGAGGDGGRGQGYGATAQPGSNGAGGGTNAGAGGRGGDGGGWGQNGAAGATGANGNAGNGAGGQAGGIAGFAIDGLSNIDIVLNGTVIGPTQ